MENQAQILNELLSERVHPVCKKHMYIGNKVPPKPNGCKDCWFAYYVWDLASTPPNLRQERLDQLEEVIHHTVEYAEKGKFGDDFKLYEPGDPRFQVQFTKEGE